MVMRELGDPQDRIKSVIVGGTNGKGSVSAALAAILGQGGSRVGLNISPHLTSVEERIVIDGVAVSSDDLNRAAIIIRDTAKAVGTFLSFHEAITATAYLLMHDLNCEWGVFEVGVGGRLDAANIIRNPEASVIVSVGLDHQLLLGDTISKIAREKAGIMRENTPVITGQMQPEAEKELSECALSVGARRYSYGRDYSVMLESHEIPYFRSREWGDVALAPSLVGEHQIHNMSVAICAGRVLGSSIGNCSGGVSSVHWPARLERVSYHGREILLDCAHNVPGVEALCHYLRSRKLFNITCIFGAIKTKEWREMATRLAPYVSRWLLLEPVSEHAVSCLELSKFLSGFDAKQEVFGGDYERLLAKVAGEKGSGGIVATGSIYMIGGLRALIVPNDRPLWHRIPFKRTANS